MLDRDALKTLLRAHPAALYVLAVGDGAGVHATLVSWVTPVSTEPPMVAVALEAHGTTLPLLRRAGAFTVGPLGADGRALAQRVGRRGTEAPDKSAGLTTAAGPAAGAPVVAGTLGWLECRVRAVHPAGDHVVVIGDVAAAGLAPGTAPLAALELLTASAAGWRYGV